MKLIPLSGKIGAGKFAIVDDEDGHLSEFRWYLRAGYPATGSGDRCRFMHRLINQTPKGSMTDHVNGDPLDNRRFNLRSCSPAENGKNRSPNRNNTSGVHGVYQQSGQKTWSVKIGVNGKRLYLGSFATLAEASAARDRAARESFGSFYRPHTQAKDLMNA